jgi:hypothetical protein
MSSSRTQSLHSLLEALLAEPASDGGDGHDQVVQQPRRSLRSSSCLYLHQPRQRVFDSRGQASCIATLARDMVPYLCSGHMRGLIHHIGHSHAVSVMYLPASLIESCDSLRVHALAALLLVYVRKLWVPIIQASPLPVTHISVVKLLVGFVTNGTPVSGDITICSIRHPSEFPIIRACLFFTFLLLHF